MRLVRSHGLHLDDLLGVFDAKRALTTKLEPNYIR